MAGFSLPTKSLDKVSDNGPNAPGEAPTCRSSYVMLMILPTDQPPPYQATAIPTLDRGEHGPAALSAPIPKRYTEGTSARGNFLSAIEGGGSTKPSFLPQNGKYFPSGLNNHSCISEKRPSFSYLAVVPGLLHRMQPSRGRQSFHVCVTLVRPIVRAESALPRKNGKRLLPVWKFFSL